MSRLKEKAMLMRLSVHGWSGRAREKAVENDAKDRYGIASEGVIRAGKRLLPGCNELEAVHNKAGVIRTEWRKWTLPWLDEKGTRIITTKAYQSYAKKFNEQSRAYEEICELFFDKYADAKLDAAWTLGALYDDSQYPSEDKLRKSFWIDTQILPFPAGEDFRAQMNEHDTAVIRGSIEKAVDDAVRQAQEALWSEMKGALDALQERIGDPDHIIKSSMVTGLVELCDRAKELTLTEEDKVTEFADEIRQWAIGAPRKKNEAGRVEAAERARKIATRMDGLIGWAA